MPGRTTAAELEDGDLGAAAAVNLPMEDGRLDAWPRADGEPERAAERLVGRGEERDSGKRSRIRGFGGAGVIPNEPLPVVKICEFTGVLRQRRGAVFLGAHEQKPDPWID